MARTETWYGKLTVLPTGEHAGDLEESHFRLHVPPELLFHEDVASQSNVVFFTRQQFGQDKHFEFSKSRANPTPSSYNIVLKPFAEYCQLYTREILVQQSGEVLFFLEDRRFLKATLRQFADALSVMLAK